MTVIASTMDRLYGWLREGPSPDCDRILGEALDRAEPAWFERIVEILFERGFASSWAALIGQYDVLAERIDERIDVDSPAVRAGVAQAVRSENANTRLNALHIVRKRPTTHLAYILPVALLDETPKVRELAARLLREMADSYLNRIEASSPAESDSARELDEAHHQLVLALHEALATFDTHNRLEVIEACLWFVDDLGETLWTKLTRPRSTSGRVACECLDRWNRPRLARFLLSALKHAALRGAAGGVLRKWRTADEISALLRQDALLEDPEIMRALSGVQNPLWFSEMDGELSELAAELRPLAPHWICNAGYSESAKMKLLSRWLHAADPALHGAVVYLLPRMDNPVSQTLLEEVADSESELASFANWCARALDADAIRRALQTGATHKPPPDVVTGASPIELETAGAECIMLWSACRRASDAELGPLIENLRRQARLYRPRLREFLQAPDPRDRLLAMQVVNTKELAWQFTDELKLLEHDAEAEVRGFAASMRKRWTDGSTNAQDESPNADIVDSPSSSAAGFDLARRDLQRALAMTAGDDMNGADADLAARLRDLLREVYPIMSAQEAGGEGDQS